jgi:hypothetical protein
VKKFYYILLLSFFLLFSNVPRISAQSSASSVDVYERIGGDIDALNYFYDQNESQVTSEDVLASILANGPILRKRLNASMNYYSTISDDSEFGESLISVINSEAGINAAVSQLEQAINAGDAESYEQASESYDYYVEQLNSSVENVNASVGGVGEEYETFMVISTILSLVLSVFLFKLSKDKAISPSEKLQNAYEFELFKSALWPFFGSLASLIWYELTPTGGTLYVLWGPIVFGYFYFLKAFYGYWSTERPKLNLLKAEEFAKVEKAFK